MQRSAGKTSLYRFGADLMMMFSVALGMLVVLG